MPVLIELHFIRHKVWQINYASLQKKNQADKKNTRHFPAVSRLIIQEQAVAYT